MGTNDGSGVMFDAHLYAWMKAGNLLASLAFLSPEYFALARSACPRHLLFPFAVLTVRDTSSVPFWGFSCIYAQQTLFCVSACSSERSATMKHFGAHLLDCCTSTRHISSLEQPILTDGGGVFGGWLLS